MSVRLPSHARKIKQNLHNEVAFSDRHTVFVLIVIGIWQILINISKDTFDPDSRESRRQKLGFYMGDARVKATTLHSFKGWETRSLVVYTGHVFNESAKALVYISMTRLKRHLKTSLLTIVSAIPEFAEYGKTWPDFNEM